jgi:hypothetical protein
VGVRDVSPPLLLSHTHMALLWGKGEGGIFSWGCVGDFSWADEWWFCGIGRDEKRKTDRKERVWVLQPKKF